MNEKNMKSLTVGFSTKKIEKTYIEHIKKTAGINDIEILCYENNGEYSLTEIYNKILIESKNDIICLIHDDLILPNNNWARKILKHFNSTNYGILGVAGTTDLPMGGKWWEDQTKMVGIVKHSSGGKTWENRYSTNFIGDIIDVCCIDGLFMSLDRNRIKNNFDEDFKGFHLYDIPWSFNNHLNGVKVGVIFDVKITHKSIGMTNDEWEKNREQFVEKYRDKLPFKIKPEIKYEHKEIKLKETPKLGIIIPTKGNVDLLKQCINSIHDFDGYTNFKIYIADTGSTDEEKTEIKSFISKMSYINLIEYDFYNFAVINNDVVENYVDKDTEILLFCNNDIKLQNNAITRMVDTYLKNKKTVGTIGCRLHYKDNTVQHSGIVMFISQNGKMNGQNHMVNIHLSHYGLRSYYTYHKDIKKDILGNTAAFMMMTKKLFQEIGGFDISYKECFEDVQLNIECINRNKDNIFVGDAVCYHYESQTRNKSDEKLKREAEDYTKRIIPFILKNKKTYNYFTNIKAKDFEMLMEQKIGQVVQNTGNTFRNLV